MCEIYQTTTLEDKFGNLEESLNCIASTHMCDQNLKLPRNHVTKKTGKDSDRGRRDSKVERRERERDRYRQKRRMMDREKAWDASIVDN